MQQEKQTKQTTNIVQN